MAVCPCEEGQDVYSISVVSDKGNANPQCPLDLLSFTEVPFLEEGQTLLVRQWDCKNCISLQTESTDRCSLFSVDIDIEKDNLEITKTEDNFVGCSVKSKNVLTRLFERKIGIAIGGKIIQLLMNNNLMSLRFTSKDKPTTERTQDTSNNRWRRYKRAASFDSRKLVLLFSILSSMGTMMLIYLTLRVKQVNDGIVHV
ncbi:PREDICTED: uncharacterized protein LOC104605010 isoform X2 [Nelumbo nucifera]|uniref:Uncharacterized protein LOC104605010 isoform X2 n=2 Tax=Nelumbo nucifera TaxID=4432 RepID=A0A1U8AKQ1_NELNU|nr:PREDICTED: uncharacterized protein LOC104605010 isoform X2 [Nelumbo nucifera]DAD41137.1 TPA_asm: hypothetical protein HUJ06_015460 [Nelumbo nucifera]